MDSDKDYAVAKEIVQSGQSDEEWDVLRQGKGSWPEDERKSWKQYRKYSLDKLIDMMDAFKKTADVAPSRQRVGYEYRYRYRYYEISATFKDAKPRKGIKGTVYKCAEKYHGRYRNKIDDSIFYANESNDLEVHLRFEEKRDAQDFLVELSRLRSEHHQFRDLIEFDRSPVEVSVHTEADPIFFSDYVTTDSTSPECLTLADLHTDHSELTTVVYDPADPRIGLCSFENFSDFREVPPRMRLFRCHIAPNWGNAKYAKDLDNNIIYATQLFHDYFNGMQTDSDDVEIEMTLRYDGCEAEVSVPVDVDGTHENRYKVFVMIIFRNEAVAAYMKRRFRDFTEVGPLELRSYLFMKNLEIAKAVLDIRYKVTMARWGCTE